MPPLLALVICSVCVLLALRIEGRKSEAVSSAVWIPTLWVLAIASKPLGIWLGTSGTAEEGSPLDRLFLSTLAFAGVLVLAHRKFSVAQVLRENKWLVAVLMYSLVSTLWSDITLIALKRWVRSSIVVIMGSVLVSENRPREALESVLRRSAYVLIPFSILLIKYYPALGVDYGRWSGLQMWIGVTVHKNTLGRLCLIASAFILWAEYCRVRGGNQGTDRYVRLADLSVLALALFLLKGAENAYSATSIGTLVVGAVAFFWLQRLRAHHIVVPKTVLVGVLCALMATGALTPFVGGSNMASLSGLFGRSDTLTGRTDTWAELVPVVYSRPLVGYGFGSFWTTERRDFYQMSHGHNGYLDILLDSGALGLLLYSGLMISFCFELHRALSWDYDLACFGISLVFMAAAYNYTESSLGFLDEHMTAVVILACLVTRTRRVCEVFLEQRQYS